MTNNSASQLAGTLLSNRGHDFHGGLIGRLIYGLDINNQTSKPNDSFIISTFNIINYVHDYFFNSTLYSPYNLTTSAKYKGNNAETILGILLIVLVVLTCFLSLFAWMLVFKCRYSFLVLSIYDFFVTEESLIHIKIETERHKSIQRHSQLKKHLIICVLIFVCVVSLCITTCFVMASSVFLSQTLRLPNNSSTTTMTQINPMNYSNSNFEKADSFSLLWQKAGDNLSVILNDFTVKSGNILMRFIENASDAMITLIRNSVNDMTSDVMDHLNATKLFQQSLLLMDNIQSTISNLDYIRKSAKSFTSQASEQKGAFQVIRTNLEKSLDKACSTPRFDMAKCLSLRSELSKYQMTINTSKINSDSSINMEFLIKQISLNITSIRQTIEAEKTKFMNNIQRITNNTIKSLNIKDTFQSIESIWVQINQSLIPFQQDINTVNDQIIDVIDIIGVITVVMIVVMSLFSVAVIIILSITFYKLLYQFYLEYIILTGIINLTESQPYSVLMNLKEKGKLNREKRSFPISSTHHFLFLFLTCFVLIFVSVLGLICLYLGLFINDETCTTLFTDTGLDLMDNIIDQVMKRNWKYLIEFIDKLGAASIQIQLTQPTGIFKKIRNQCIGNNGLIYALNMTHFIDINKIIMSPNNLRLLANSKSSLENAVLYVDFKNIIPGSVDKLLQDTKELVKYFDEIDYKPSITELSKTLVDFPNCERWINNAEAYFIADSSVQVDLKQFKTTLNKIKILDTNSRKPLYDRFITLGTLQNNSILLSQLINTINQVKSIDPTDKEIKKFLDLTYNKHIMETFVQRILNHISSIYDDMIRIIFPCYTIKETASLVMTSLCAKNSQKLYWGSLVIDLVSFGINNIVFVLILFVVFHLCWWISRDLLIMQYYEPNVSKC